MNRLEAEGRAGRQGRMADYLSRMDFIVLDELGYLPFAQSGGQLLFHLISRLYEQASIVVTTSLASGEWPSLVAGDAKMTTALQEVPLKSRREARQRATLGRSIHGQPDQTVDARFHDEARNIGMLHRIGGGLIHAAQQCEQPPY